MLVGSTQHCTVPFSARFIYSYFMPATYCLLFLVEPAGSSGSRWRFGSCWVSGKLAVTLDSGWRIRSKVFKDS